MADALNALSEYHVTVQKTALLSGIMQASQPPDLIIYDVGDGQVLNDPDLLAMRRKNSGIPLVLVSGSISPEQMRQVIHLNAADLLTKPVDVRKLVEVVGDQLNVAHAASTQIYGFISCIGGAGATSLAINTADILCQQKRDARNATCLIDLDFSTGACGSFIDAHNDFDLKSVADHPNRIDVELMDTIRKSHPSGFSVYSFKLPDLPFYKSGEELVLRMLDVLSFKYDYVVVDIPYYETPWKSAVLGGLTDAFLVTDLAIPSLRQTRDIYERVRKGNIAPSHSTIIVNRHRLRMFFNSISRRDVRKLFKDLPISFVSDDHRTMTEAINRGILPREVTSRSDFAKESTKAFAEHLKRNGISLR